jgi:hypothetical protein
MRWRHGRTWLNWRTTAQTPNKMVLRMKDDEVNFTGSEITENEAAHRLFTASRQIRRYGDEIPATRGTPRSGTWSRGFANPETTPDHRLRSRRRVRMSVDDGGVWRGSSAARANSTVMVAPREIGKGELGKRIPRTSLYTGHAPRPPERAGFQAASAPCAGAILWKG